MAMPWETYLSARRSARYHVQVELEGAPAGLPDLGDVTVEGRVVRVFRTDGRLQVGDRVRFAVSVCRAGAKVPAGGAWWKPAEELAAARFLEAFLDGTPPDCAVALWQSQIVGAPSDVPQMGSGGAGRRRGGFRAWLGRLLGGA
jgi:hypothetical protein